MTLFAIGAALTLILSACASTQSTAPAPTLVRLNLDGRVDVGGYNLYVNCRGFGDPTVVLDAGLGVASDSWVLVQPEVAQFTRVCTYDRAGLGNSDRGPTPRTTRRIANELHMLLSNSGLQPPYVLVGHSFGGLNMRMYASEYPDEVAGMVLVDASHEDWDARIREFFTPEDYANIIGRIEQNPEGVDIAESNREMHDTGSLDNIPLRVLTNHRRFGVEQLDEVYLELQDSLTRLSTNGRKVLAEDSGQLTPLAQPQLVVNAIRDVVDEVRAAPAGSVQ
jgi:pimeloyl-ACP methyl ester carboxylesterase